MNCGTEWKTYSQALAILEEAVLETRPGLEPLRVKIMVQNLFGAIN